MGTVGLRARRVRLTTGVLSRSYLAIGEQGLDTGDCKRGITMHANDERSTQTATLVVLTAMVFLADGCFRSRTSPREPAAPAPASSSVTSAPATPTPTPPDSP